MLENARKSDYARAAMIADAHAQDKVDYSRVFASAVDRLHAEGRYRVFIDILRNKGGVPERTLLRRA